jgi:hypothetical protein
VHNSTVLYRATVTGVGIGAMLAIAVATIDNIMVARLASQTFACPGPRCTRIVQIVESEPIHVMVAFALGFAVAFTWSLHRRSLNHG